ncbi:hypothetical protein [Sporosarcina sp. SAFN-010]|uniref:hypothetical protein n=1 Tax=Sporosarcina sp. SAFN-010 TaxID=3387273 RepID=UPI003F81DBA9
MRLREIKKILEENIFNLEIKYKRDAQKGTNEITDVHKIYVSVMNLAEFNFLEEEIKKLENIPSVFNNKNDKIIVEDSTFRHFESIVNNIIMKVKAVIFAIRDAIPEQSQNSVSIKLPNSIDLVKVSDSIKKINNILSQSLVGKYKSTVKLQNFDSGSNWIEVVLQNTDAVVLFGSIVKHTLSYVREEYMQWRITKSKIDNTNIEQSAKELVLKALEDTIKTQARLHAKVITEEFEITANQQEYENGLTHSIQALAELIHEGAEVHTALNAPLEVKDAYPDEKEIRNFIDTKMKLLPDATETIIEDMEQIDENPEIDDSEET